MVELTRLRQARQWRAMSQQDLSKASGVRQATISQLERGLTAARTSTVRRLAAALDVDPQQLQQVDRAEDRR
jgi:transcriptional regulator with XRE-family HTH domain